MELERLLPAESFVKFEANALRDFKIIWRNPLLDNTACQLDTPYCIKYTQGDLGFNENTVEFKGERYGGGGLGNNGGGVRCGIRNGVQVKGIGKNPLAGKDAHFWHSHGGNSIELALREAIWGEVCNLALPYGAARVHAIVDTNSHVPYLAHDGKRQARRALVYRQAKLRPAHFMRAPFFEPAELAGISISDSVRTKAAVNALPEAFTSIFGQLVSAGNSPPIVVHFSHFVRRLAHQLAVARTKRIFHGGLSPSNLSLDGGWLDFDTITGISDYGRIIMGGFDLNDFWSDHQDLASVIDEFWWHIVKYFPDAKLQALPKNAFSEKFLELLVQHEAREFAKLTGIPGKYIDLNAPDAIYRFYKVLKELMKAGNEVPFYFSPRHLWVMPLQMGTYSVRKILLASSAVRTKPKLEETLSSLIQDEKLRERFITVYWLLRESFDIIRESCCSDIRWVFLQFNAIRRNSTVPALYRNNLDKAIEEIISSDTEPASFVESVLKEATILLGSHKGSPLPLDYFGLEGVTLCSENGLSGRLTNQSLPIVAQRAADLIGSTK